MAPADPAAGGGGGPLACCGAPAPCAGPEVVRTQAALGGDDGSSEDDLDGDPELESSNASPRVHGSKSRPMAPVGPAAAAAGQGKPEKRMVSASIRVEGMTCAACAGSVERALTPARGVQKASVSVVTGMARVEFDANVCSGRALCEVIQGVGFGAEIDCTDEDKKRIMAASIQVEGMTCAACAGTVERALTAARGVQKATVSCVTGMARVEFDANLCSGKLLCRVIEGEGFGAKVQAEDEVEKMSSRAALHVESSCPRERLEELARQLDGVLSCRTLAKGHQRIDYDPYVVGARVLLTRLKDAAGPCFEVRPTDEGSADEHLMGYEEHIRGLVRDVKWSTPPALIVFFLEIVIPAAKLDGDITPLEFEVLQGHIPLRLLLLVLCATIVIVGPGMRFHKAAIGAIKRRFPNMDVLVSVAAGTAYLYSLVIVGVCVSTPSDSPTVHELKHASGHFLAMGPILIAVVIFGKILESKAKLKAMKALVDIPSSLPPTAVICEEKGDQTIPMELVELGDVVRIFAGGRVPVDGNVCSDAEVHVDESMLTGESRPVSKKNGDAILAGTLCLSGGCLIRVTKVGGDTTLGQMTKLVQDAQASKAGMQRVADSLARVFVPTVFFIAILTFFVWTALVFTGAQDLPSMSNEENSGTDHSGMSGMGNSGMDNSGTTEDDHGTGFLKVLFSMNFSISVLMIACPCAMGLAVPMAVMVAVGLAAKRGCLIKNAEAMEVAARLDYLVLDKTGTITEGAPRVTHAAFCPEVFAKIESAWASMHSTKQNAWASVGSGADAFGPLNTIKSLTSVESKQTAGSAFGDRFSAKSSVGSRRERALSTVAVETIGEAKMGSDTKALKDCFWWIMGSLESTSDHPIAKCVQGTVQSMTHLPPASGSQDFEVTAGRGVRCTLNELCGVSARVGNLSYFQETSSEPLSTAGAALIQWMQDMQLKGHIVVLMHIDGMPAGAVALRDPIRKESPWVIDYVQRKLGAKVYMCTGDNGATAQAIAREVGIEHVIAEAMPATKSELVAKLQKPEEPGGRPRRVCFCGDGMNDSPALAQADVGVAIGVGADVAVEAADVALVRDEIDELVAFLALSRATFKTIFVNFFWAFCFNIVCLPLAAGVFYPTAHIPPLVAGIGMSCSSLFVVWSSLLLKFFKAPQASYTSTEDASRCVPPAPESADEDKKRIMAASIQVEGMTCAGCSGSVEQALTAAKGVQKASVSCVTGLARVEFDAKLCSGKALCEVIESMGFGAKIEAEDEVKNMCSKAALHVESNCPREKLEGLARKLDGVLSCRTLAKGHQRIDYDPYVVGARVLLARLNDAVGPDFELRPTDEGSTDEHLMGYEEHIRGLVRDVMWATPPALLVFILEIVIPAAKLDGDITPLELEVLRGHVPVNLLLLVLCATVVIFGPGMRFHKAAIGAVKRRFPNMDLLVSVAAGFAYLYSLVIVGVCISTPSDSPTVHELKHASGHFLAMGPILIAVVIFGKITESKAKLRAMKALVDIPSSLPPTAVICEEKGDQTIPMELVELGDVVRIFAGGRVPVDGIVCSDAVVHVDESMLTGESRPVSKTNGDALLAGTLCLSGGCLIRVSKVGGDTTLGQMMKLVQDAQASKAGMQRVADSIARVFVPTVFVIAILTFFVWTTLVFTGYQELPSMSNEENSGTDHSGMDNSGMGVDDSGTNEDDHGTGFLKVLFSMNFSISVLMIACPCAMGLAVPMAVMVAVGIAAKRGCLVKNAEALEVAARLDALVLDKTGTITEGAPRVTHAAYCPEVFAPMQSAWASMQSSAAFEPLSTVKTAATVESKQTAGSAFGGRFSARSSVGSKRERALLEPLTVETIGEARSGGDTKAMKDCFWWIMGSLESTSDHPIAKCVQGAVQQMAHLPPASGSQDFEVTAGRGVRCALNELGGVTARVGNLSYYQETSSEPPSDAGAALIQWMKDMQQQGHIVVLMHINGMPAGAVALRDPIRKESPAVIDYVQRKLGATVYMCTGDNAATAQAIAREVGIEHVIAEAMPATKSELVARLQKPATPGGRPLRVCFCGDGMNDSPALAQADVGVAIGVGADVAVEAADVALVRDEIDELAAFLALGRATFKTILVNFFWAFCFNIVCLPLAAGVFYPTAHIPPLVAGIGMSCSSLFVVWWSLLLKLYFKAPFASRHDEEHDLDPDIRGPMAPADDGQGKDEHRVVSSASIRVEGMTCAACAGSVERALTAAKGVQKASVSCVTGLARVEFDASLCSGRLLCDVIESVGFGAEVDCTDEDKKRIMAASIQVEGMTCAACAGSVERALTAATGVQKASVSCVTGLARVEFDAKFCSGKALCELIEGVGFGAKVDAEDEIEKMSSKAALHVESSCPRDKLEGLARQLDGVLGCQTLAKGHQRIDYDPYVVGARVLLARLADAVGPDFDLRPTDEGSSDEHLMGYEEHIRGLARDAKWAAPPALLVFILEIVIPAARLDGDITPLEFEVLQGHIPLRLLLLVLCATVVIVGPGMRFHKAAIGAIKRRFPNMDVLVSVAAGLAYLYSLVIVGVCVSTPSDSPTVSELKHASGHFLAMGPILIAVVIFGKIIESKAKLRAMKALVDIPSSLPPTAVICEEKGDQTIPMELVQLGDVVRIFAGGRVPVDGSLCSDADVHVDESMLTGESRPVSKKNGDALLAGTLCVSGGCLIRVTKVGGDTTLGQMMKLVQDAQASKAGMQRVADSLARVFVPTVFVIAIVTFFVWTTLVFTGAQELPNMSNEDSGTDSSGHSGHSGMDNSGMDNSGTNEDDRGTGFLKVLFSMNFSISVLMIACPCAMGLAVPMAVMVAVGLAAKRGCLVKNAEALEVAARLDALVLDKTGTITEGAPRVMHAAYCPEVFVPMKKAWAAMNSTQHNAWASVGSDAVAFEPLNTIKTLESKQSAGSAFGDRFSARSSVGSKRERALPTVETIGDAKTIGETIGDSKAMKDLFWWIMGSLESTSDHPIAKCVQGTVQKMGHLPPASASQDFEVTQSRGVRCTLHELGGVTARVGNLSYYQETTSKPPSDAGTAMIQWMKDMQQKGHIVVLMHIDGMPAGAVALRDPIREESPWVIDYVQRRLGAKVYMCTGDNTATAQAIAREVGIEHVIAEAMPATKSELVAKLQKPTKPGGRPRRVCFCGDGMNDSPALAQADVGVAIGVGADVAVEAADVALVRDEIDELVAFMALSRATFKTILINFFWAFCFNIVCLPLAAGVFYPTAHIPPLVAGIGMSCSSVFVVLQSLLLRFFKAPHASRRGAEDAVRKVPPASTDSEHHGASDGRGASEPIVIDS